MSEKEYNNYFSNLATNQDFTKESAKIVTLESVEVLFDQIAKNSMNTTELKALLKDLDHNMDRLLETIDLLDKKIDNKFNRMLDKLDEILKKLADIRIAITDHNLVS
jgi:chromosome segregation ATPase